jgi:predicted regulator of Ras-like GTPase activity (Roadblock/LC7/MglB family)
MVKKKQSQETATAIMVDEDEISATPNEYAIFSSQVLDSSQEISELFELGDVSSVLIEGKESKALCMNIEGNKISIFMEKNADDASILKQISP